MTHWKVKGSVQEVSDVLGEPRDLVRWWPSVYLEVRQMEPGDARGIGKVVRLHTRGWRPYTLKWEFRVTESREPFGYSLEARGDFSGTGVWTFEPSGDSVEITYDWRVRADKPILRHLSFLLKPVFSVNHHWAMTKGEESLRAELVRRSGQAE